MISRSNSIATRLSQATQQMNDWSVGQFFQTSQNNQNVWRLVIQGDTLTVPSISFMFRPLGTGRFPLLECRNLQILGVTYTKDELMSFRYWFEYDPESNMFGGYYGSTSPNALGDTTNVTVSIEIHSTTNGTITTDDLASTYSGMTITVEKIQ